MGKRNQSEKEFDEQLAKLSKPIKSKKETKPMKTNTTKKTVLLTVAATLLSLAAIVAQAWYFYDMGAKTQKSENQRITAEVQKQVAQLKQAQ